MLENNSLDLMTGADASLTVKPPSNGGGGTGATVEILDPESWLRLGKGRWQPGALSGWCWWPTGPVLVVTETEDESLVFTVRRVSLLRSRWEVRD